MSVTRRGFLGMGAALLGSVLLPDMESDVDPEYELLLTHLEKEGLRDGPPQFEELGKVFAEEIMATMERPGFCDRLFRDVEYTPVEKYETGLVYQLTDLEIVELSAVEGTEFGYVLETLG